MDPLPPYGAMLGLSTVRADDGRLLWVMPFGDPVVGRPGFLHGGAIAGLLEFAALGSVYEALGEHAGITVKPINVTVDFMRGGIGHDTYASGEVTRLGRRVANVIARAWQDDPAKPIASAQMNVLIRRKD